MTLQTSSDICECRTCEGGVERPFQKRLTPTDAGAFSRAHSFDIFQFACRETDIGRPIFYGSVEPISSRCLVSLLGRVPIKRHASALRHEAENNLLDCRD